MSWIWLWILSFLFLSASVWNPWLESAGVRILVALDSVFLTGVTGIVFLSAYYFLPSSMTLKLPLSAQATGSILSRLASGAFWLFLTALLFGTYAVNQKVLHAFLSSADEHSCYFLAECLLRGRLWVEPHPLSDFFNVVHVGNRAGKWFSVYPPGWPLLWAGGIRLGIVDWLNPVMVTISAGLFFLAGRRVYGAPAAAAGILLTAITPFFLFTGASYFSHGTCLLMAGLFFYAYLKWTEAEDPKLRFFWALIAGAAVGYGLMTRYLTMAAIAAPFLLYHYLPVFLRKRSWRKDDWAAVVIIALFFLLVLWQNYEITGKPFKAPNKFDKSWERLGFRADYTPLTGLNYLVARFFYLADWMPGAWVILFFIACFSWARLTHLQRLSLAAFWCPALAYFFYYSWGGNQWGPRYYYEGIFFLGMGAAYGFYTLWTNGSARLRRGLVCACLFALGTNAFLFAKQARFHGEASAQRKALYTYAEKHLTQPSIVFIKGFLGARLVMAQEDAVRNSPFLDGKVLYAHDLGDRNSELMNYYPDRKAYKGSYDREHLMPVLVSITEDGRKIE